MAVPVEKQTFSGSFSSADAQSDRGATRFRLRLRAVGDDGEGRERTVVVHDLSASGFLIESDEPLAMGSEIAIDMPGSGKVSAAIVWSRDKFHGGHFRRPISPDAVRRALSESQVVWLNLSRSSATDRRVTDKPTGSDEIDSLMRHAAVRIPPEFGRANERFSPRTSLLVIAGSSLALWGAIALAI